MQSRPRVSLPPSQRIVFAFLAICLAAVVAVQTFEPRSAAATTTVEGTLEVVHEDHFGKGHSVHQYFLRGRGGTMTELLFDDLGPEGLGGRRVRVAGTIAAPGRLYVGSTAAVTDLGADSTTATEGYPTATADLKKKVAVILFNFIDQPDDKPISAVETDQAVFGAPSGGSTTAKSSNDYYFENSFEGWNLEGAVASDGATSNHVFGWITLPATKSTDSCNYTSWGQTARNIAAEEHGFDDANYEHVVHIMAPNSCQFGGVAYMPGKYSWTIAKAWGTRSVAESVRWINSHELGHNFSVHHSGSWRCTANGAPVVLSSNCTLSQYGDPFSVMGSFGERHMTNYQKGRLGWVGTANTQTVSSGFSTVTLHAVETRSTGVQSLRIPRGNGRKSDFYYVEYRTSYGMFTDDNATEAGVLIRIAPDYATNAVSKLLDATPDTPQFTDAVFTEGTPFNDPALGITVKVISVTPGVSADIEVTLSGSTSGGTKTNNGKKK